MRTLIATIAPSVLLFAGFVGTTMALRGQTTGAYPLPPAHPPEAQRTEDEARKVAERNRAERERKRKETGTPVELISSYVRAQVGPVPESLGVNAFYKKYVDAQGIPVISSERVPDDALLVARDIIISMLA